MHMILISANFQKLYLITILNPKTRFFENYINLLIENNSSIL
jgi:hypothetical protein